jgi:virulence factor Mce-like protein
MRINASRLRLEIQRTRTPTLWLVWLIFCAFIAGYIILSNQAFFISPFSSDRTYWVAVSDAKSVQPGHLDVLIAGIKAGVVTDDKVVGDHAALKLEIDSKYGPLYRNARLTLRPYTPLDDMYVEIESRGTPSAGALSSNQMLSMDHTSVPVDVSQVLNTFDPDTADRLHTLLVEFSRGLGGTAGDELRQAFVDMVPFLHLAQRATQVIAQRHAAMAALIHNLSLLTTALATRNGQISQLVTEGDSSLAELASHDTAFQATLAQLPSTLSSMQRSFATVQRAETTLDPALRALRPTADALRAGLRAAQQFSERARPALVALSPTVHQLRPFMAELNPTSVRLNRGLVQLQPIAPQVDSISRKLVPCQFAVGKFFQWTMSVYKLQDAWGAFPRGEATVDLDSAGGLVKPPSDSYQSSCTGTEPSS